MIDWRTAVTAVLVSAVVAYGTITFAAGQYVYQILTNTSKIIVLEGAVEDHTTVIASIRTEATLNSERFTYIKEELTRLRDEPNLKQE